MMTAPTLKVRADAAIFDSAEAIGFLRRFSSVMSKGENAARLEGAATLIESLMDRVAEMERSLWEARDQNAANIRLRETAETELDRLQSEIIALDARLTENIQQSATDQAFFVEEARRLSGLLENSEAALLRATADLEDLRTRLAALGDALVVVPIQTLRATRAQFEILAQGFAENGDVISQAICEVGGCMMDQAMVNGADPLPT
jgi:hypothetical protein